MRRGGPACRLAAHTQQVVQRGEGAEGLAARRRLLPAHQQASWLASTAVGRALAPTNLGAALPALPPPCQHPPRRHRTAPKQAQRAPPRREERAQQAAPRQAAGAAPPPRHATEVPAQQAGQGTPHLRAAAAGRAPPLPAAGGHRRQAPAAVGCRLRQGAERPTQPQTAPPPAAGGRRLLLAAGVPRRLPATAPAAAGTSLPLPCRPAGTQAERGITGGTTSENSGGSRRAADALGRQAGRRVADAREGAAAHHELQELEARRLVLELCLVPSVLPKHRLQRQAGAGAGAGAGREAQLCGQEARRRAGHTSCWAPSRRQQLQSRTAGRSPAALAPVTASATTAGHRAPPAPSPASA